MRYVSEHTANAWSSGVFVDSTRPMSRVTVQAPSVVLREVRETRKYFQDKVYSALALGSPGVPVELPNVRSVEWNRSIDTDVASCNITLWNNRPLPIDQLPEEGRFDQPGYYSPRRGSNSFWDSTPNMWRDILVPDRVVRTYQGYGSDFSVGPEFDEFMYETGVWLIDEVSFNADQTIRIACRDISRMLLDHYAIKPVIPVWPLTFFCSETEIQPGDTTMTGTIQVAAYQHNSNEPWMGGNNLPVNGHYPADAADSSLDTYWLSFGNGSPNAPYSFEWVQFGWSGSVNGIKLSTVGTGYTVFVSLWNGSTWLGDRKVPYDPNHWASFPNGSDQMYVHSYTQSSETMEVVLPATYEGVQAIRFTFTNLWNSGVRLTTATGGRYPYRAAVRMAWASGTASITSPDVPVQVAGNINDYAQIVAQLCAYVFAWWPDAASGANFVTYSDGSRRYFAPRAATTGSIPKNLGVGDCWGSLEMAGVCPVVPLGAEIFHAKPLMDGINYVKEVLGFNFYVDEHGGVVFRLPNLFVNGNYVDQGETRNRLTGEDREPYTLNAPLYLRADSGGDDRVVLGEDQSLLSYEETLSSRNVRETVLVGNLDGSVSAESTRGNVWGTPFRRLAAWTDQNFADSTEAATMADVIAKRIASSATSARMRIPAHPGIQVDDQVWIVEGTTSTYDLHYVRAISSSWDAERGYWYYDLETNRLVL